MARDESQREDLLREATALVERVEFLSRRAPRSDVGVGSEAAPIVAGFRANGAFSLFCGEDPVYQFNSAGELRRAYVGGRLYKAVGGRLIELERVRQPDRVELRRHDLTAAEETDFLTRMASQIEDLKTLLNSGDFQVTRQVPPGDDIVSRVQEWLAQNGSPIIAARPNA